MIYVDLGVSVGDKNASQKVADKAYAVVCEYADIKRRQQLGEKFDSIDLKLLNAINAIDFDNVCMQLAVDKLGMVYAILS